MKKLLVIFSIGLIVLAFIFGIIFFSDLFASGNERKTINSAVLNLNPDNKFHKFDTLKKSKVDLPKFQTIIIQGVKVDIHFPKDTAWQGTILALPGWNFPRDDWGKRSTLFKDALKRGYAIVAPEMGKSIYHTTVYPETRYEWTTNPNLQWAARTLPDSLQFRLGLFKASDRNFVLGLSTGAHGAIILAQNRPEIFKGVAGLSGDYINELLPKDNLYIGYYGSYEKFPDRWMGLDNPNANIDKLKAPIYLGHGKRDVVTPVSQSQIFFENLQIKFPYLKKKLHIDEEADHSYRYWQTEVKPMLDFFDSIKNPKLQ